MRAARAIFLGLAFLAFLSGCTTTSNSAGGDSGRDQTLREYRDSLTQLRSANYAESKRLLDDAIVTLGGITAGDPSARKSRGYFHSESTKNFRGEPYERAMAFYYRGILYWMDGEIDNARACFRTAAIEDTSGGAEADSDFVLFQYLDGLASAKLAGDGSDALRRAQQSVRLSSPPPYDAHANVLIFVEMGTGPKKVAGGQYGELLQYVPGSSVAVSAGIEVEGHNVQIGAYDDLTFQAVSRGGRVMDQVLANKAAFKTGTGVFGDAALISGGILAATQHGAGTHADEVGLGLMVAGLVGKVISAATTPKADIRMWDNLPNLLSFAALNLPPGSHEASITFKDSNGRATSTQRVSFQVVSNHDTVIFVSAP